MAEHNELGKLGEELAVEFLQKNGYDILETNWVFQKAEIDIIAQKENILAIVEVKTRSSIDFGLPQDFVKPKKIQLLVKAINEYLIKNDYNSLYSLAKLLIKAKTQDSILKIISNIDEILSRYYLVNAKNLQEFYVLLRNQIKGRLNNYD